MSALRAVVHDDGDSIILKVYAPGNRNPVVEMKLAPLGALHLSTDLSQAALLHLQRGQQ